jgi:hypothetical protein
MNEDSFYALSSISESLSVFRQPRTSWEDLTQVLQGEHYWRTRWDSGTKLLIEEEDKSSDHYGSWEVVVVHQRIADKTQAIMLAARLTHQRLEDLGILEVPLTERELVSDSSYDDLF